MELNHFDARGWINSDENITINKHVHYEIEKEHVHDFIEISYVFSGEGYQCVNGVTRHVQRGDCLFLNFSDVHSFYPIGSIGIINCLVNPAFISSELVDSENALDILTLTSFKDFSGYAEDFTSIFTFAGHEILDVEALLDNMLQEYEQKECGYKVAIKGYFDVLLTKIFRIQKRLSNLDIQNEVMKIAPQVLEYIEKNYNKKISLSELAEQSFYNPTYFSTVFKTCFGITLTDYITEKRITSAFKYLNDSNLTIERISRLVGFKNKNQFYKKFKEHTGQTPTEYRNRMLETAEQPPEAETDHRNKR